MLLTRCTATAAVALLSLSGCEKPKPPTITPRSAQVDSVGPSGLKLKVKLDVHNPNSFPLSVRHLSGKLLVGSGVEVGNAQIPTQFSVPGGKTEPVSSNVQVKWSNIAGLLPLASTGKPIAYTFEGLASIGGEKLNVDVPFRLKGKLTAEQVIGAGLRGLKLH